MRSIPCDTMWSHVTILNAPDIYNLHILKRIIPADFTWNDHFTWKQFETSIENQNSLHPFPVFPINLIYIFQKLNLHYIQFSNIGRQYKKVKLIIITQFMIKLFYWNWAKVWKIQNKNAKFLKEAFWKCPNHEIIKSNKS